VRKYISTIRYGLVARIPGFHPGGSGSIPGIGIFFSFSFNFIYNPALIICGNSLFYCNQNWTGNFPYVIFISSCEIKCCGITLMRQFILISAKDKVIM
jgi:hypothetical protein